MKKETRHNPETKQRPNFNDKPWPSALNLKIIKHTTIPLSLRLFLFTIKRHKDLEICFFFFFSTTAVRNAAAPEWIRDVVLVSDLKDLVLIASFLGLFHFKKNSSYFHVNHINLPHAIANTGQCVITMESKIIVLQEKATNLYCYHAYEISRPKIVMLKSCIIFILRKRM